MRPDRELTAEEQRLKEKYAHLPAVFTRWIELPEPNDLGLPAGDYVLVEDIEAAAEAYDSDDIRFLAVALRWAYATDR